MAELRSVVEVAKRVGGMWCSVVPGKLNPRQPLSVQYRNAAETLKQCCDVCDRAGLTMLLEPLCHVNRSGQLLLSSLRQADALARTVDHPRCKVLFDVSHHHALGDDLMADVERYWDSIGYFQLGDNPGRKEPGTGTIDYRTLTTELSRRCYTGLLGMEHGNSLPGSIGEEAVISAYDRLNRYCNA
jgi:hydroxypyruvate isomerase